MGEPGRATGLVRAIGLMSGTSLDGVDAALLETDGDGAVRVVAALTLPYDAALRLALRDLLAWAQAQDRPGPLPPQQAAVERALTGAHVEVVRQLLAQAGDDAAGAALLGFHGQTVAHRPERGWTWQVGDAALLARETGLAVVHDFRSADVAAGGQGAPLVPAYHRCLARTAGLAAPVAVLNIGGVANLTWLGAADDALVACDTGPGNALIDDWLQAHTGQSHDAEGRCAASGQVHERLVDTLCAHPFFARPAPKSLDRNSFAVDGLAGLGLADGAATLTAFTAEAVARSVPLLPAAPARWLVTGGGRHNPTLMRMLAARLAAPVDAIEAIGANGDTLEAEAFAYLAVRSRAGLPLSWPGTTGVPAPQRGGRFVPAG